MKPDLKLTCAMSTMLLAAGCGSSGPQDYYVDQDTAICTDAGGRRIADANCAPRGVTGGGHWYYIGRGSMIPPYGEPVYGGSNVRYPGRSYQTAPAESAVTRSAAVSRGGFGSTAHGGGAGE